MTRRMQIRFLSRSYAVDFASTGEEALHLAARCAYEAILVDIGLAGTLTGVDVMRSLKLTPLHARTAMVAVTGYASERDREKLVGAGFDLYLAKPFKWQEFSEVIRLAVRLTGDGAVQAPPPLAEMFFTPLDEVDEARWVDAPMPTPVRPVQPTPLRAMDTPPSPPRATIPEPVFPAFPLGGDTVPRAAGYNPYANLRPAPPADLARGVEIEDAVVIAPTPAPPKPQMGPFLVWTPLSAF